MAGFKQFRRLALKVVACFIFWGALYPVSAQTITSVSLLTDPQQTQSYLHVVNINGKDFKTLGTEKTPIQIYLAPNEGVADLTAEIISDTLIEGRFTATANYQLNSVIVAPADKSPLSFVVPEVTCKESDVQVQYEITPNEQVRNLFGNGLAKNYHVVQISIINKCSKKIVVPLGGVKIEPRWHLGETRHGIYELGDSTIAPFGLDHVMSIYNTDRTLTGIRAVAFNIMQALATLGSASQQFFGPGFTQGVAIFGGAFRTGAGEIFKDMSSQQLKSLSAETFNATETIGPKGSAPVQKFIFVPRKEVKLPSGDRQRVDDIKSIRVTWFTGSDETQTQQATPVTTQGKGT